MHPFSNIHTYSTYIHTYIHTYKQYGTVSVGRFAHVEVLFFAAVFVVEDHLVVVSGHHDARALIENFQVVCVCNIRADEISGLYFGLGLPMPGRRERRSVG